MQRVWGSLVVVVFWAMAALAVGGPGLVKRAGVLTSHVTGGAGPAASQTGAAPVLEHFPVRDSRDLPITAAPAPGPGHGRVATPAGSGTPASAPGTSGTLTTEQQLAQLVLNAINGDRAAAGLPALTWSPALARSAHQHDLAMVAADTLSHQLPGEPPLGTRETQQGVRWSWAGENIGYTTDRSPAGALGIHRAMMAEQPPDDGHRQNILTTSGNVIGVDVVLDTAHGRLWLTEDFARV